MRVNKVGVNKSGLICLSFITAVVISGCSITPQVISTQDMKKEIHSSLKILNDTMKKVDKPITLDEAILRGVHHNRKNKLQIMESALSEQQLDMVYYDMLPELTAKAGYSRRDNSTASTSQNADGEADPFGYSISQDKEKGNASIAFSWNILDFGLSYVRAQQQADKFLIAKEKEKKVIHNITQEIRRSYYQAVSAEDLLNKTKPMMNEIREALRDSNKIKNLKIKSPLVALQYQSGMVT